MGAAGPDFWRGSDPVLVELGHVLRVLSDGALAHESRFEAAEALTLRTLGWRGPLSLAALARALRLRPEQARIVCRRLERLGLVAKEADAADRRVRVVVLTPQGTEVAQRILSRSANLSRDLLEGLSPAEREQCLNAARHLVDRGTQLIEEGRRPGPGRP